MDHSKVGEFKVTLYFRVCGIALSENILQISATRIQHDTIFSTKAPSSQDDCNLCHVDKNYPTHFLVLT